MEVNVGKTEFSLVAIAWSLSTKNAYNEILLVLVLLVLFVLVLFVLVFSCLVCVLYYYHMSIYLALFLAHRYHLCMESQHVHEYFSVTDS